MKTLKFKFWDHCTCICSVVLFYLHFACQFVMCCVCVFVCSAELYLSSNKFDSAYACIQEAANYNPVSHVVSYMVCVNMTINISIFHSARFWIVFSTWAALVWCWEGCVKSYFPAVSDLCLMRAISRIRHKSETPTHPSAHQTIAFCGLSLYINLIAIVVLAGFFLEDMLGPSSDKQKYR